MPYERLSAALRVDRLPSGQRQLVRDLVIDLGKDLGLGDEYPGFTTSATGTTIVTVPQCFVTDFSSVPGVFRSLFRFDSVDLAGCCHDLAYRVRVPRDKADEIWRIVASSGNRNAGRFRARLGWLGLRIGGRFAYKPTDDPFRRNGSDENDLEECESRSAA
jgi:hypothetical protein